MPTRMFTYNSLPQYFFGEKNEDEKSDKSNYDDVHLSEPNLSRIPSPASSLASTKKLEWDSGADIGYIYDTRKSKSYPSLNMDSFKITTPEQTDKSTGAKIKSLSCIEEVKVQKKIKPKSFKHSTPLDYNRRIMQSCGDSRNNNNKEVQTDLFIHEDKSLQTEITDLLGPRHILSTSSSSKHSSKNSSSNNSTSKHSSSKHSSSKHSSSKNSSSKNSSKNSSTKSGSFKYIPGSEISDKSDKSLVSNVKNTDTSGSSSPLGQMISTQYSKNLIDDIDKSLAILQKFIKSKDYSYDTKKHYAKKIVTKIINNRYSDDTSPESSQSEVDKKYVECGIQCDEITKKSQIISERSDCKIKESLEKLNALQTDLKNWRSAQTLSEKLFEARKSHTSSHVDDDNKRDYLLTHSKNERKRQLSWINNEISYLQKLKDLLQLNSTSNTSTATKTTSTSDVEDIEKRFNEEFGLVPEKENLNKLSKLLSNEQIKLILEHDVHNNTSYNSHKNTERKMAPSNVKKSENKMACRDAATQYQLIEKTSSTNTSTSSADESIIIEKAIDKKKIDNKGTAYFLTFEEESVSEYDSLEQKHLEQVVVKIPKYSRTKITSTNRNENPRTLEEHLLKNRPDFVRMANWRWTQVRPLDQERHNIFTCHEMMEMSRKKYNNLPEIQEKVKNYKTLVERRHNRFMQYIFSKKLQKKTLQGHICLATCRSVLSSE